MVAEILGVGTELLLGDIANTNAQFMSKVLAGLGISVYGHTAVGDNAARLTAALEYAFGKADMVVACGGLGPTQDDITKEVSAAYFGKEMVLHEPSWQAVQRRFGGRVLPENAVRNAMVPAGSIILPNNHGSAPGICIEENGKILILLPGPPSELEPMFMEYAVPFLRKKTVLAFISRTLKIVGLGESRVETILQDLIAAQTNPTIAPYAKLTEVALRITAAAPTDEAAHELIAPVATEIYQRIGPHIYGEDNDSMAKIILDSLEKSGQTLAIAESCTGGLLTSAFVDIPGSSKNLLEGVVTYSNNAKTARLGIDEDLLRTHGAVSPQVAAAMAEGIAKTSGAAIGISTTGIAGPDGGTDEKPIGLVYIGLHIAGKPTQTKELRTIGGRNEIRIRAVVSAMDMLRLAMEEQQSAL
ncbi:MAG: competence/damage-inducible protein A [Defluviitaleaceae bacterium]|nr:competence/damage-inducible protein A [Defluviitaleaceae bacterium]